MRPRAKLPFICLLILIVSSCGRDNVTWEKYTSNEGGFAITMPKPVKKSDKTEVTAFGKQVRHYLEWKPSTFAIDKFKLFLVSYTDCPARISADSILLGTMLDSAIYLRKKDFTEDEDIPSQIIELNGYPGRAFFFDGGGNTQVQVKMSIINNKLYDLTVISKKNYSTNNEISNFYNSFEPFK